MSEKYEEITFDPMRYEESRHLFITQHENERVEVDPFVGEVWKDNVRKTRATFRGFWLDSIKGIKMFLPIEEIK